jgi:hypothetical protein
MAFPPVTSADNGGDGFAQVGAVRNDGVWNRQQARYARVQDPRGCPRRRRVPHRGDDAHLVERQIRRDRQPAHRESDDHGAW